MSSPLALEKRAASRTAPVRLHKKRSHGRRIGVLAAKLTARIASVPNGRDARCLDVGCGDMTLAEAIHTRLPQTTWRCMDVHRLPLGLAGDRRWGKYRRFDGKTIPYADRAFTVALLCNVLHNAEENAAQLLAEAARVADYVLVKDHFEYGLYSRSMLRLTDFVGNRGYGINVPRRYFNRDSFRKLAAGRRLDIVALDCGIDLYGHLPVVRTVLQPSWHFIALLRRR